MILPPSDCSLPGGFPTILHLIDDVEDVLLVTGVTPPTLDQMALASFIEDAALERHLRSGVGLHELNRHCTTHAPSPRRSSSASPSRANRT